MTPLLRFPPGLDAAAFLTTYWQSRPLLMRGALAGFTSPLDAGELAGLSCEEGVEARLVLERDGSHPWEVRHGPFGEDDFASLPESHWTLLVQDVDKHAPEVAAWLDAFRFIPDWRVDDIMISYAADDGSVGPHLDEYDVFLIQAEGRRRWLFDAEPAYDAHVLPGLDLRILKDFKPSEEHLVEPGDVLYLPPGVPHWGIADGPCMTWSVGFRAATWRELANSWCEYAAEHRLPPRRFRDLGLLPQAHSAEIRPEVLERIRTTLEEGKSSAPQALFREWFGCFVTEPKEHLQVFPAHAPLTPDALRTALTNGAGLIRNGFTRLAFCRGDEGADFLFANGEAYRSDGPCAALLPTLTGKAALSADELLPWVEEPDCLALLCRLYNDGHYELVG